MANTNMDGLCVGLFRVTDENREDLLRLVQCTYLGERCKFCGKEYRTLEDLKDTV
jgi:hypothetical protein